MRNKFFNIALGQAYKLQGSRQRILVLLGKLASKANTLEADTLSIQSAKNKFAVLSRLVSCYVHGEYRNIPWKTFLTVLAAIIYFVNPIDLVADFIPVAGLADDFAVLLWVYNSITEEINKFLTWEKTRLIKL